MVVDWTPHPGAEGVALWVAGTRDPLASRQVNPGIATLQALAGTTYPITVAYRPSHFDYMLAFDQLGEFTLEARLER